MPRRRVVLYRVHFGEPDEHDNPWSYCATIKEARLERKRALEDIDADAVEAGSYQAEFIGRIERVTLADLPPRELAARILNGAGFIDDTEVVVPSPHEPPGGSVEL